jgi:hypothetical protein
MEQSHDEILRNPIELFPHPSRVPGIFSPSNGIEYTLGGQNVN